MIQAFVSVLSLILSPLRFLLQCFKLLHGICSDLLDLVCFFLHLSHNKAAFLFLLLWHETGLFLL